MSGPDGLRTDVLEAWATRSDPARSVPTPADPLDVSLTLEFVRWAMARCEEAAAGSSGRP